MSETAASKVKTQLFIGGEWRAPDSGAYFENVSPITGQVVGRIARSNAADVEAALDAAGDETGFVVFAGCSAGAGAMLVCSPPIIMAAAPPTTTRAPRGARIIQVFTGFLLDRAVRA